MHIVTDGHEMPMRGDVAVGEIGGVATTLQLAPFQCSISVPVPPGGPTASQLVDARQLTSTRLPTPPPGAVAGSAKVHVAPSHCTVRCCPPTATHPITPVQEMS